MRDDKTSAREMRGRLNAFQRSMLQWNAMHPYNAVHVARMPGTPDQSRLQQAIRRVLDGRSLSSLTLDPGKATFCYRGGPADCEINDLGGGTSPGDLISAEMERQLNTPFRLDAPFSPFRFFTTRWNDSFALGISYLHLVADAESIVLLLKDIVENYRGIQEPPPREPCGTGDPRQSVLPAQLAAYARKLAAFPSSIADMRCSFRPPSAKAKDMHNRLMLFTLGPGSLQGLVATAKSWGITLNDLLLALLMKSCALLATGREKAKRRTKLSVGCIVNTRRDHGIERRGVFGLFLGSFIITHAVPRQTALRELGQDIGRLTLEIKRKKLYLATPLELCFGQFMLSFYSTERREKLYPKHYPLWGGLTNMNINKLWGPPESEAPLDYVRAVCTGPATPVVLSFTTVREAANIGLSYRSGVFSAADADRLADCLLGQIAELEVRA